MILVSRTNYLTSARTSRQIDRQISCSICEHLIAVACKCVLSVVVQPRMGVLACHSAVWPAVEGSTTTLPPGIPARSSVRLSTNYNTESSSAPLELVGQPRGFHRSCQKVRLCRHIRSLIETYAYTLVAILRLSSCVWSMATRSLLVMTALSTLLTRLERWLSCYSFLAWTSSKCFPFVSLISHQGHFQ